MWRIPEASSRCVVQYMRGTNVENAVLPTLRTPRIARSEGSRGGPVEVSITHHCHYSGEW
eukprot:3066264-Pyramimonas_sp.AAC.1